MSRIPITKRTADGAAIDGTAELTYSLDKTTVHDFRDLDWKRMDLGPGERFEFPLEHNL